jgi:hypothetical protein
LRRAMRFSGNRNNAETLLRDSEGGGTLGKSTLEPLSFFVSSRFCSEPLALVMATISIPEIVDSLMRVLLLRGEFWTFAACSRVCRLWLRVCNYCLNRDAALLRQLELVANSTKVPLGMLQERCRKRDRNIDWS